MDILSEICSVELLLNIGESLDEMSKVSCDNVVVDDKLLIIEDSEFVSGDKYVVEWYSFEVDSSDESKRDW